MSKLQKISKYEGATIITFCAVLFPRQQTVIKRKDTHANSRGLMNGIPQLHFLLCALVVTENKYKELIQM
jgi:hypothetical protein